MPALFSETWATRIAVERFKLALDSPISEDNADNQQTPEIPHYDAPIGAANVKIAAPHGLEIELPNPHRADMGDALQF